MYSGHISSLIILVVIYAVLLLFRNVPVRIRTFVYKLCCLFCYIPQTELDGDVHCRSHHVVGLLLGSLFVCCFFMAFSITSGQEVGRGVSCSVVGLLVFGSKLSSVLYPCTGGQR